MITVCEGKARASYVTIWQMGVIMYGASPYMKAALMSLNSGHKTDDRNEPDLNMLILCSLDILLEQSKLENYFQC